MRVSFSNLAHINNGDIAPQQLTIVVGDNGAGKTLLLETISYIKKYYQKKKHALILNFLEQHDNHINADFDFQKILDKLEGTEKRPEVNVELSIKSVDDLNKSFGKLIENEYEKVVNGINQRVLLTDESDFRFQFLDLEIFKRKEKYIYNLQLRKRSRERLFISLFDGKNRISTRVVNLSTLKMWGENLPVSNDKNLRDIEQELKEVITQEIKSMVVSDFYDNYFGSDRILYLPSERNLLMDNALIKAASDIEVDDNLKRRYSDRLFTSAYFNFKHFAETFPEEMDRFTSNTEYLFGGKLKYSDNGEIMSIVMKNGKEIRRELFSTKQNRLIPFLLINQPILPYQEIIIEEPEAHMSLKSQKEFMEFLSTLLKNRNRQFYITTHSDVFFLFLSNLLLEDPSIQVNVYELIEQENGCFTLAIKEKTEYGYEINMFTDILNQLYEETYKIQNKNNS